LIRCSRRRSKTISSYSGFGKRETGYYKKVTGRNSSTRPSIAMLGRAIGRRSGMSRSRRGFRGRLFGRRWGSERRARNWSCMFLEWEFFKQSCANEFAFNMGVLMAAVCHLMGMVVQEVKRPDR
jgi:hypothetical protein